MRDWPGYGAQKNFAAALASNDWILSLDADERVTPELAAEIRALLEREPGRTRLSDSARDLVSRALDPQHRLVSRLPAAALRSPRRRAGTAGACTSRSSCSTGAPGTLRGELQHYAYRDISHHLATIDRYTTLAAEQWHAEGRRHRSARRGVHPPLAFLRNYVLRGGFTTARAGCSSRRSTRITSS